MRCRLIAALLLSTGLSPGAIAQAPPPERHLYVGVTLVDPATETVQRNSYILVEGNRIAAVGRGRPRSVRGAIVHDFSGRFALPGLIDTHAHVTLGPGRMVNESGPRLQAVPRPEVTAFHARRLLSYGVTTIRSPGGDLGLARDYARQVADGSLLGPEAIQAGEIVDRLPIPFDGLVVRPSADLPITEIVRRQAAGGAQAIKLYTGLSEADLREGIAAARAHNLPTIAHLGDVSWTRAAELGIDALVHMMPVSPDLLPADRRQAYLARRRPGGFAFFEWFEAADFGAPEMRAMIATLARERIHVDATLIAFEPAFWADDPQRLARDAAGFHPEMLASWQQGFRFDLGWQPDDYRRARAVWPKVLELTRRLHEAGVPLTIGTDLANPYVAPGISVSQEMALHQRAGIPAWAVLRMATSDAARLLGMGNRVGHLRPGYEADIAFIAADPRPDLNRVADVVAVVNNGALLSPQELRNSR